jgi:hypothetical protein
MLPQAGELKPAFGTTSRIGATRSNRFPMGLGSKSSGIYLTGLAKGGCPAQRCPNSWRQVYFRLREFKSGIAVPAPEGAPLGKQVIFRFSNAAFYLRPCSQRYGPSVRRPGRIQFVQLTADFSGDGLGARPAESFLAMKGKCKSKAIRLSPPSPEYTYAEPGQTFFDWDDPKPHSFALYHIERTKLYSYMEKTPGALSSYHHRF